MAFSTSNNRPLARKDTDFDSIPDSWIDEAFLADYQGGQNMIYKGFARPGASAALPVWQVSKLTYDGNNNVTSITWPLRKVNASDVASANTSAASNDYEFIWNSRTSYTYV